MGNVALKVTLDIKYPCEVRQYSDGSLASYAAEGANTIFILCGSISNQKYTRNDVSNDFFKGHVYHAAIIKNNFVYLSEYKDTYCAPHSF